MTISRKKSKSKCLQLENAPHGLTPLHEAAVRGDIKIAAALVSAGADINMKNRNGQTPLLWHMAICSTTNIEIVNFLVSQGADVNAKDNMGFAPIHEAAIRGKREVVDFFISNGADYNMKNDYGETPLYLWHNTTKAPK